MAAVHSRCGHYIFVLFLSSFFLGFFLASSQWSQTGCLPHLHTWCGFSANLECRSEMYCMRLPENTGCQKSPSRHHCATLSGCIFAAKACIDNLKKNLLNSNNSSTCPRSMVNFGPLTAEICLRVWGTPANFSRFRVFSALLHGTLVVGVCQTAALNRGRHLYSAGRPSRAMAHILVMFCFYKDCTNWLFIITFTLTVVCQM